jgi:hypothetical protein
MISHVKKILRRLHFTTLAASLLLLSGAGTNAFAVLISLNTSSLSGRAGILDFQLFDGDFTANNSATISAIATNGTLQGRNCTVGCSGGPPFIINDSLGFGEFSQNLLLGTTLSFNLTTTNKFAGSGADLLILNLLNAATGFTLVDTNLDLLSGPIPFQDALLVLNLRTGALQLPTLSTPSIGITAVPEPGALLLLITGGLLMASKVRRRFYC